MHDRLNEWYSTIMGYIVWNPRAVTTTTTIVIPNWIETVEELKIQLRTIDCCLSVPFRLVPTLAQLS